MSSSFPPRGSAGCSAGHATCTSDCSEAQPRGVGKAQINRTWGAAACSQSLRSQPPKSPGSFDQRSCDFAVCLWQVPTSASCPTAMGSLFLLQGSCQAQHQHQSKVFSDFLLFVPGWTFLPVPLFSFVGRAKRLARDHQPLPSL